MRTQPRLLMALLILWVIWSSSPSSLSARATYGIASWYGEEAGERTANGEKFDPRHLTCASWIYPLGSRVRVTNLLNGRSVVCRVNDRGPAWRLGRTIDLTRAAFARIGQTRRGLVPVRVEPLWRLGRPRRMNLADAGELRKKTGGLQ